MVEPNLTSSLVSTLTVEFNYQSHHLHVMLVKTDVQLMVTLSQSCFYTELRNLLYTCCRDGASRDNKLPRKTKQKRQSIKGSRKLEDYCLARMYVKHYQSTRRVEVTYICTHTNHLLGLEECKYLPLPQSVRKEMQEKFAQGVTLERIMDGM